MERRRPGRPRPTLPALPLNELQARSHVFYQALIPAGDPMVLDSQGNPSLAKLNLYRRGVDQPEVRWLGQARYSGVLPFHDAPANERSVAAPNPTHDRTLARSFSREQSVHLHGGAARRQL